VGSRGVNRRARARASEPSSRIPVCTLLEWSRIGSGGAVTIPCTPWPVALACMVEAVIGVLCCEQQHPGVNSADGVKSGRCEIEAVNREREEEKGACHHLGQRTSASCFGQHAPMSTPWAATGAPVPPGKPRVARWRIARNARVRALGWIAQWRGCWRVRARGTWYERSL